mgnify:FL=1
MIIPVDFTGVILVVALCQALKVERFLRAVVR